MDGRAHRRGRRCAPIARIIAATFTVVGTLAPKGQGGWGQDQDDVILVPLETARRRLMGAMGLPPGAVLTPGATASRSAAWMSATTSPARRMTRIWSGVFWNPAEDPPDAAELAALPTTGRWGGPGLMVLPTALLVAASLAVAAAAGPLYSFSERTARELLDPVVYVQEVLGG